MIEGGNSSPHRPPCAGTELCWLGPAKQHARAKDLKIPVFVNILTVPNWDPDHPGPVKPFERPLVVPDAVTNCETPLSSPIDCPSDYCSGWIGTTPGSYSRVTSQPNAVPPQSVNGGYTQPETVIAVAVANGGANYHDGDILVVTGGVVPTLGAGASFKVVSVDGAGKILKPVINYGGWFTTLPASPNPVSGGAGTGATLALIFGPATISLAVCDKRGWKGVQAKRQWHGRFGFINGQDGCANTGCLSGGTFVGWRAYDSAPDQNKYLTDSYTIGMQTSYQIQKTYNDSAGNPHTITNTWSLNYIYNGVMTVHPDSGLRTLTGYAVVTQQSWHVSGDSFLISIGRVPDPSDIVAISMDYDPTASGFTQIYFSESDINNRPSTIGYIDYIEGFNACGGQLVYTGSNELALTDFNSYVASNPGFVDAAYLQAFFAATFLSVPGTAPASFTNTISNTVTLTDGFQEIDFSATSVTPSPAPGANVETFSFSLQNTHVLADTNQASSVYADVVSLLGQWDLTDDLQYPWRTDSMQSAAPLMTRNEVPVNVFPSAQFSLMADFRSPLTDVNGVAPFLSGWIPTWTQFWYDTNSFAFLWAPGESAGTAAATDLVQLIDGQVLGAPNPAGYLDYFDFGFEDWQMCLFIDDDDGIINADWWRQGSGMFLSDYNRLNGTQIPLNATQWGNNFQNINKPPGGWLLYNDQTIIDLAGQTLSNNTTPHDAGSLWAGKYAEIKENWPSLNAARPAGADKFLFDETKVYCVTSMSGSGPGSTWTLTDSQGNTPSSLSMPGDWGGPAVAGFYSGCTYASGTLTLGTLAFSVPSDWTTGSGDAATCFGPLRWPTVPALLGRHNVTPDATNKIFTWGNAQTTFGLSAAGTEQVDLYTKGMVLVAANVTASRVVTPWAALTLYTVGQMILDSGGNVQVVTTGGLSGATTPAWTGTTTNDGVVVWSFLGSAESFFTTAAAYSNVFWVQIHGSAPWYENDQFAKGDFVILTTLNDYRTNGEYSRLFDVLDCTGTQVTLPTQNHGFASFTQDQHCLGFHPCHPRVVCFTPNGETFPNGITVAFPGTFTLDDIYGERWQGVVQWVMDDLVWQAPHHPCGSPSLSILADPGDTVDGSAIIWLMDNGTCQADSFDEDTEVQTMYYKMVPMVEAILALPSNYGAGRNETPADPFGLYGGLTWLSPVTNAQGAGVYNPPQYIGYVVGGQPAAANTAFGLHATIEATVASGTCRFDYSDDVIP